MKMRPSEIVSCDLQYLFVISGERWTSPSTENVIVGAMGRTSTRSPAQPVEVADLSYGLFVWTVYCEFAHEAGMYNKEYTTIQGYQNMSVLCTEYVHLVQWNFWLVAAKGAQVFFYYKEKCSTFMNSPDCKLFCMEVSLY